MLLPALILFVIDWRRIRSISAREKCLPRTQIINQIGEKEMDDDCA
jgi:hypothetical protein